MAQILSNQGEYPGNKSMIEAFEAIFKRQPDARKVNIPSGYTYFGQFIIHDISSIDGTNRHAPKDLPWENDKKDDYWATVCNLHEPDFNLESIYGRPADLNSEPVDSSSELPFLRVGSTAPSGGPRQTSSLSYPCDLPRKPNSYEVEIPDARNDENVVLAQTHLAFIKFHNVLVMKLSERPEYQDDGKFKRKELFDKARELNIRYYQRIILDDFLPRVVQTDDLIWAAHNLNSDRLHYQPYTDSFIPVEFAVAAFRFGHSMIRSKYEINAFFREDESDPALLPATLDQLQTFTGASKMNNNPSGSLPSEWIIDWNRFYQLDNTKKNFAQTINTTLPKELLELQPLIVDTTKGRANSIAALDLFRSRQFRLSSGQAIAHSMHVARLPAYRIRKAINIKSVDKSITKEKRLQIKRDLIAQFSTNSPLWYYILLEAQSEETRQLGPVGGRLVAQTICQLIYNSKISVLRDPVKNGDEFLLDGRFSMPEMLRRIRNARLDESLPTYPPNTQRFDETNPLGNGLIQMQTEEIDNN
ncbi:MAG: peroxidase family protein [Pyrinomonadaceae bacterium]